VEHTLEGTFEDFFGQSIHFQMQELSFEELKSNMQRAANRGSTETGLADSQVVFCPTPCGLWMLGSCSVPGCSGAVVWHCDLKDCVHNGYRYL
jgi:hypothetical protein